MKFVFSNGARIPALGFGVFRMSEDQVDAIVPAALEAGFRHFDTAQIYKNEAALGSALARSGAKRDELFLTTKVWIDNYAPDLFVSSVKQSLDKLQVDDVDLLLLHWPGQSVPVEAQIAMLNAAHDAGMARHIGVSNQNMHWLRRSVEYSTAPIVTNQIEIHPYLDQSAMARQAQALGMALTAYFALADGAVPRDPVLQAIGGRYGKSAAQVVLRWVVQKGHIVLTKTANPARLAENFDIFDFELGATDMAEIDGLARQDGRIIRRPDLTPGWDD